MAPAEPRWPLLLLRRPLLGELVVTAALGVYAACISQLGAPRPMPFYERDPTLSYDYVRPATVPTTMLALLSVLIPGGCMLAYVASCALVHAAPRALAVRSAAWHCLAVAQALLLTMAITDTIKVATGFPRPNFYSYCDYAGRRSNASAYLAATNPNVLGDVRRCLAPEADVHESQLSFPSGHASISFAGMTLTALFARHALGVRPGAHFSPSALLAASPLILAAWIALTRVRDRYHHPVDVVCGAVLGALGGRAAWRHLVASGRATLLPALWAHPHAEGAGAGDAGADGGPVHVMLEQ